jgi:Gas vesicle protein
MTSPSRDLQAEQSGGRPVGRPADAYLSTHTQGQSLADVLERVLDKGIVIVGDIQVRLLDIELLTIKLRLLVASVDKAKEMGVNWWEADDFASIPDGEGERAELVRRVKALEERVTSDGESTGRRKQSGAKTGRSSR